jgi:hypothetical protein
VIGVCCSHVLPSPGEVTPMDLILDIIADGIASFSGYPIWW